MYLTSLLLSLLIGSTTAHPGHTSFPSHQHHLTNSTNPTNTTTLPFSKKHKRSQTDGCTDTILPLLCTSPSALPTPPPYTISFSSSSSLVEIGFTIPSDAIGPCTLSVSLPHSAVG